jgi:hypothetical protein
MHIYSAYLMLGSVGNAIIPAAKWPVGMRSFWAGRRGVSNRKSLQGVVPVLPGPVDQVANSLAALGVPVPRRVRPGYDRIV